MLSERYRLEHDRYYGRRWSGDRYINDDVCEFCPTDEGGPLALLFDWAERWETV